MKKLILIVLVLVAIGVGAGAYYIRKGGPEPQVTALQVTRGEEVFDVVVLALSDTRGPAPVAQALYAETDASRARREQQRLQRAAMRDGYRPPGHKPDKRARRLIQALGDIDAL